MPRVELVKPEAPSTTFTSGATLLDLIAGGGWGLGRIANVVGDKSSGKSLICIEACANFARLYGAENIRYNETEAAFSKEYAYSIGLPKGVSFVSDDSESRQGSNTVEEVNEDLEKFLASRHSKPSLYILDSADALSDKAEMERDIGEATYGTGKAKAFSEMFRRQTRPIEDANCCLMIVSQIRDKIGVTFGETKTRSGGRALDFYSSQVNWLAEIGKIKRTVTSVERVVGVKVLVNNKKNKIGRPFRQAELSLYFNYGFDDELSNIEWLKKNKTGAGEEFLTATLDQYTKAIGDARKARSREDHHFLAEQLKQAVIARWNEIESALEPSLKKYNE